MARIIDRDLVHTPTTAGVTSAVATGGATLPPELLAAAGRRLSIVAVVYAVAMVTQYLLARVVGGSPSMQFLASDGPWGLLTTVFVVISLAVVVLVRSGLVPPVLIPDAGLLFMVAGALGLEVIILWYPPAIPLEFMGLSWVAVWLAFFPLIVPSTPGKTLLAALAAASFRPVFVLALVARTDRALPSADLMAWLTFPNFVSVALAVLGSRVVVGLGRDVDRARRMGSYELKERLGRGGMGEVWRAEHQLLARPAAIKLIRPEALGHAGGDARRELLKRFEREAQATAVLSSPHTVQVHDYGVTADATFYYVMELLHGLDADDLTERFGPQPPARVIRILSQVCDSLAEAHAAGMVHRDIKPANVYLCRRGMEFDFVKVLDFGLVKAMSGGTPEVSVLTHSNVAAGTPAFMAPEVAQGVANLDGRTDLYAVGCLGYWLLTGRLVFEGDPLQVMYAHVREAPPPLAQRTEQAVPAELEEILLACLAKSPAARPSGADEVRRALDRISGAGCWDRDTAAEWWRQHLPELSR